MNIDNIGNITVWNRTVYSGRGGGGKSLSQLIDELRFPLAVMVVFQHSMPDALAVDGSISEYVRQMILGICRCAVPLFFIISGYLFFLNIYDFSWRQYCGKILSRVKSILIPYMIWNALYILFHAAQSLAFPEQMIASGKLPIQDFSMMDYVSCFWHNTVMGEGNEYFPINIPLWYMRDLFIVCLASPVIWFLIKHLKCWWVIMLAVLYIFTDGTNSFTGLNPTTLFFFSLGAFMGIRKVHNLPESKNWTIVILAFLFLWIASVFFIDSTLIARIQNILGCVAIVSFMSLTGEHQWLQDKKNYTMMIYVMQVFWLCLFHQAFIRLVPVDNDFTRIVSYFLLCGLTVIASMFTVNIGRQIMPKVMKLVGDR